LTQDKIILACITRSNKWQVCCCCHNCSLLYSAVYTCLTAQKFTYRRNAVSCIAKCLSNYMERKLIACSIQYLYYDKEFLLNCKQLMFPASFLCSWPCVSNEWLYRTNTVHPQPICSKHKVLKTLHRTLHIIKHTVTLLVTICFIKPMYIQAAYYTCAQNCITPCAMHVWKLNQCNQNVTTSCHTVHKLSINCHCVMASNWSSATECHHFLPHCPQIINKLSLCNGIKLKQCNQNVTTSCHTVHKLSINCHKVMASNSSSAIRMWPLHATLSTNYQ
jgi:hypothetical protein